MIQVIEAYALDIGELNGLPLYLNSVEAIELEQGAAEVYEISC